MTPLERVAQAIRISLHLATGREREAADRAALAVLQALREPSEAMKRDGRFAFVDEGTVDSGECWELMIDTAIEEGPPPSGE